MPPIVREVLTVVAIGVAIIGTLLGIGYYAYKNRPDRPAPTKVVQAATLTPRPTYTIPPTYTPYPTQVPVVATATPYPTYTIPPTNTPVPPDTKTPTATKTATPKDLFFEDFESSPNSELQIVSGRGEISNGIFTAQEDNTWLLIGSDEWTDYEVQSTMSTNPCWCSIDRDCCLVGARAQDINNFVGIAWGAGPKWYIRKDGKFTEIRSAEIKRLPRASIRLSLLVQGDKYAFYEDQKEIASFINEDFAGGMVVFRIGFDSKIGDIKIVPR